MTEMISLKKQIEVLTMERDALKRKLSETTESSGDVKPEMYILEREVLKTKQFLEREKQSLKVQKDRLRKDLELLKIGQEELEMKREIMEHEQESFIRSYEAFSEEKEKFDMQMEEYTSQANNIEEDIDDIDEGTLLKGTTSCVCLLFVKIHRTYYHSLFPILH